MLLFFHIKQSWKQWSAFFVQYKNMFLSLSNPDKKKKELELSQWSHNQNSARTMSFVLICGKRSYFHNDPNKGWLHPQQLFNIVDRIICETHLKLFFHIQIYNKTASHVCSLIVQTAFANIRLSNNTLIWSRLLCNFLWVQNTSVSCVVRATVSK